MPIIVSRKGKNAKKIEKRSFQKEQELQKYIYDNPDSIPIYEIKEDVRFLVIDREFPTSVGNIDVLEIDNEGDIYIIETKLYKNPDKRLVLAQVLDYGASLWKYYENPDEFIRILDGRIKTRSGKNLQEEIDNSFGNSAEILENVKVNLADGLFKYVILMDGIPGHLKDLILFINQNSQFSVYAVDLEYYSFEDYEILIPHVHGVESKKHVVSVSERKKWDEASFFAEIKRIPEAKDAIVKLFDFSKDRADHIYWGTGKSTGSFNPKFKAISAKSVFSVYSDGRLSINFGWLNDNEKAIRWRQELYAEIIKIDSITKFIPKSLEKFPVVPAKIWVPVVDELVKALSRVLSAA